MRVVVPLSGGLDSAVVLAQTLNEGHECYPLFINYGQVSLRKEVAAAGDVASWARTQHRSMCHPLAHAQLPLGLVARSGAVGTGRILRPSHPKADYIPGRNAFLSLVAVNFAVEKRAPEIHVGFHRPYPGFSIGKDQMPSFVTAFNGMLVATIEETIIPHLRAPFQTLTKTGIARIGSRLGVPFGALWTCYTSDDRACGVCGSCAALAQALDSAKAVG